MNRKQKLGINGVSPGFAQIKRRRRRRRRRKETDPHPPLLLPDLDPLLDKHDTYEYVHTHTSIYTFSSCAD